MKPEMKTLAEIHAAQEIILTSLDDKSLSIEERILLQKAAGKLRDMELSIIHLVNQELVDALTPDVSTLKELTTQLNQCSDNLAAASTKIEKVAGKIGALVNALSTLLAAGLI